MEIAPPLLERGLKVCDLGADFRLRDVATFEQWYKHPHNAVDTLKQAVYGLPEWNREQIKSAQLVANPGCYPTSAILALSPFVAAGIVETKNLIVDSASGVSGAGRSSFSVDYHFPEVHDNYKAYGVATHRHTPEIEQGLSDAAGVNDGSIAVTFTPHLLPIARGILSTCYATLKEEHKTLIVDEARQVLQDRYENEPFVRIHPTGSLPHIKHIAGSNFCDIGVAIDHRTDRLIVIAAEDNLVKGASGQAIQNMNLMCGFEETAGLMGAALFP
jgi:N-acetyl-gamma-glutamyl-phosphate reductase